MPSQQPPSNQTQGWWENQEPTGSATQADTPTSSGESPESRPAKSFSLFRDRRLRARLVVAALVVQVVACLWCAWSFSSTTAPPPTRAWNALSSASPASVLHANEKDRAAHLKTWLTVAKQLPGNIKAPPRAASLGSTAADAWVAWLGKADSVASARQSAAELAKAAEDTVKAVAPSWRASGRAGEWRQPQAVNLAQALAAVQEIAVMAHAVDEGAPPLNRLSVDRQNIEAALRGAAQNQAATQQQAPHLAEAWNHLASGYAKWKPRLNALIGVSAPLSQWPEQGHALVSQAQHQARNAPVASAASAPWFALILWVVSLVFLWATCARLRHHKGLPDGETTMAEDGLVAAAADLRLQLSPLASGNLNPRLEARHAALVPVVDALNTALRRWRRHIQKKNLAWEEKLKHHQEALNKATEWAERDAAADQRADIVDHALTQWWSLEGETESTESVGDDAGKEALDDARQRAEDLDGLWRRQQDRSQHRHEKLTGAQKATRRVQDSARVLEALADRLSVVAIQAAVQAAKAGVAGRGFSVLADTLHDLATRAEAAAVGARRQADEGTGVLQEAVDADDDAVQALTDAIEHLGAIQQKLQTAADRAEDQARQAQQRQKVEKQQALASASVRDAWDEWHAARNDAAAARDEFTHPSPPEDD